MQVLKQFSLPIKGLKMGLHDYAYNIDKSFFSSFEDSPYADGNISAELNLEKKHDHLVFSVILDGSLMMDCDRCTDAIAFPIDSSFGILIKYDVEEREEEEVIYINPESSEFNCASLLYEAILLSLPLLKTCDDVENKDCNPDVLDHFQSKENDNSEEANPFSEALKNLKLN